MPRSSRHTLRAEAFPKSERLRLRTEYLRVQRSSRKVHSEHFLLLLTPHPEQAGSRVGMTVSSRVGNAVMRNRLKRWIREYVRRYKGEIPPGDVVIVAKTSAAETDHSAIDRDLGRLLSRARGTV